MLVMLEPFHASADGVLRYAATDRRALANLLARFGLGIVEVAAGAPIPGSYWGDEEAGLRGRCVLVRADTPVHSILHEASHFVCMDPARRDALDTNAGGGYEEENAVCYLQILLADELPDVGSARMMSDMDRWGYSFRLGSAGAWFSRDAGDALAFLAREGLVDGAQRPTFQLRGEAARDQISDQISER